MGVYRIDYIIYGFKMKPNDLKSKGINIHDDKFLPYIEGHPGLKQAIVYDYMGGEYVVYGRLISRSEGESGRFTSISYKDFFDGEEIEYMVDSFKELFGDSIYDDLDEEEPEFHIFSHHS